MDDFVHSIMAMSGLLVGSTLPIALSLRLPASLYGVGEVADQRVSSDPDFANAVTILWRTIVVLALAAVCPPRALAVRPLAEVRLGQILTAREERVSPHWALLKNLMPRIRFLAIGSRPCSALPAEPVS